MENNFEELNCSFDSWLDTINDEKAKKALREIFSAEYVRDNPQLELLVKLLYGNSKNATELLAVFQKLKEETKDDLGREFGDMIEGLAIALDDVETKINIETKKMVNAVDAAGERALELTSNTSQFIDQFYAKIDNHFDKRLIEKQLSFDDHVEERKHEATKDSKALIIEVFKEIVPGLVEKQLKDVNSNFTASLTKRFDELAKHNVKIWHPKRVVRDVVVFGGTMLVVGVVLIVIAKHFLQ